jgi:hypothetical protein
VSQRSVEQVVRLRRFGPKRRLRVDLHGVSVFGPGDEHALIRWEWIRDISVSDGVVVRSESTAVSFPAGAFGLDPQRLAERLEEARSIHRRPDIIGELSDSAAR